MSIEKRYDNWYIRFRPFGAQIIRLALPLAASKREAVLIEAEILEACRTHYYASLSPKAREAVTRLFDNKGWEYPSGLCGIIRPSPQPYLSLWSAIGQFLNDPMVKTSKGRVRHEFSLTHFVEFFGKDSDVAAITVREIKRYREDRQQQGVKNATINREVASLSSLFRVLVENEEVALNPVRLLKGLPMKDSYREVYISHDDFLSMLTRVTPWFSSALQIAFYTGMRRGEIAQLSRSHINLQTRIIQFRPVEVKEGRPKRIPVHRDLVPILRSLLKVPDLRTDRLIQINGSPVATSSYKRQWANAKQSLNPKLRFHDLRHTFKTNMRRSGVDVEIRESILGHWYKAKDVTTRYGRIDDRELITAVDVIRFNHGPTEVFLAAEG